MLVGNDHLGPVESVRIEDAEMFDADQPLLRQISQFNQQGQKIETVLYRDDGVALPKSSGYSLRLRRYRNTRSVERRNITDR
jgi:hypothetical protein